MDMYYTLDCQNGPGKYQCLQTRAPQRDPDHLVDICEQSCTCQNASGTDPASVVQRRMIGGPELEAAVEDVAEKRDSFITKKKLAEKDASSSTTDLTLATTLTSPATRNNNLAPEEDSPAQNATGDGLLPGYQMWCNTATTTAACASHPYEYHCDPDSGRMIWGVRLWNCHTQCRCLGVCQWEDLVYDLNIVCARDDADGDGPGRRSGAGKTPAELEIAAG